MTLWKLYRTFLVKTYDWRCTPVGRRMTIPLRWGWDGVYKTILSFKVAAFNRSDTILLTGTPRSGTTWLSELLCSSRDYCSIFEPIVMWHRYGVIRGLDWADYISPDTDWPEGKELFCKLFEGRSVHPHAFIHNSPMDLIRCRSLLIKSITTNTLLPWLAVNFQIRGMILIVRHPCAVVASLKKHLTKLHRRVPDRRQRYVRENLPHLTAYVQRLQTEEEILAVRWCCDHHAPLKHRRDNSWIQVSYEKLVLDGRNELRRIYSALDLAKSENALNRLQSSSLTVHNWSVDHSRASAEERLGNWRRSLDGEQVRRVLSVVDAFGIRGFSEDVVPDFDNIGVAT